MHHSIRTPDQRMHFGLGILPHKRKDQIDRYLRIALAVLHDLLRHIVVGDASNDRLQAPHNSIDVAYSYLAKEGGYFRTDAEHLARIPTE